MMLPSTASILGFILLITGMASASNNLTLQVNAIVGKNNVSQLECWSLLPGFSISTQPGTVGAKQIQLGLVANASYTAFPTPGPVDAGLHNAPNAQWVVALHGNGTVTFPNRTDQVLHIMTGDILIAVDTPAVSTFGHRTVWEGGSIALQIPFAPGSVPLHNTTLGGCHEK